MNRWESLSIVGVLLTCIVIWYWVYQLCTQIIEILKGLVL